MESQISMGTNAGDASAAALIGRKRKFSKEQCLLFFSLVIAILYDRLHAIGFGTWQYCVFFSVFAIIMLAFNGKALRSHKEVFFVCGIVALLMANTLIDVYGGGEETSINMVLRIINLFIAIPLLLMLIPMVLTYGLSKNAIMHFIKSYVLTALVNIFRFWGKPFSVISHGLRFNSNKNSKKILLGLIIGIPLFIVLMSLLVSADEAMKIQISRIFGFTTEGLYEFLFRLVFLLLPMFFISYSLIYATLNGQLLLKQPIVRSSSRFNDMTTAVTIIMMLLAYTIFALFQFTYLTGFQGLPEGLTYSQYAVNGFSELNVVSLINFSIFGLVLSFCKNHNGKPSKLIRHLLIALLAATLLLLASAMARLMMYIGAYGLTTKRILAFWLEITILIMLIFSALKLYKPEFRAAYWASAAIMIWYAVLNVVDCDAIIRFINV